MINGTEIDKKMYKYILFQIGTIPLFLFSFYSIFCLLRLYYFFRKIDIYNLDFKVHMYLLIGFICRIYCSLVDPWGEDNYFFHPIIRLIMFRSIQMILLLLLTIIPLEWKLCLVEYKYLSKTDKLISLVISGLTKVWVLSILITDYYYTKISIILLILLVIYVVILGIYYGIRLTNRLNSTISTESTHSFRRRQSVSMVFIIKKIRNQIYGVIYTFLLCFIGCIYWFLSVNTTEKSIYEGAIVVYVCEIFIFGIYHYFLFPFQYKMKFRKKIKKKNVISVIR